MDPLAIVIITVIVMYVVFCVGANYHDHRRWKRFKIGQDDVRKDSQFQVMCSIAGIDPNTPTPKPDPVLLELQRVVGLFETEIMKRVDVLSVRLLTGYLHSQVEVTQQKMKEMGSAWLFSDAHREHVIYSAAIQVMMLRAWENRSDLPAALQGKVSA